MVKAFNQGVLLAVVDGLGQGNQAALAARTAVSVLKKYAAGSVVSLIKRCHRSLMMARGAVISLASIDMRANMSWLGIGNVECLLLRADAAAVPSTERLRLHGGVVGYQLPILHARKTVLHENDLLIFATDGVGGDFINEVKRESPAQQIADQILREHFKGNDDALVLVVRYLGARHE
jgi:negative regulator of sigma-B (phosphoserine phosphatase)